jgi:hypothetical protein
VGVCGKNVSALVRFPTDAAPESGVRFVHHRQRPLVRRRWQRDQSRSRLLSRERVVPITPYLDGHKFDPEATRVMGVALEMVCIALRAGDCDDGIKQGIANKIIALASAGERNPDILCEQALKDIRGSQE